MSLTETYAKLAAGTETAVRQLWEQWQAGRLTRTEFIALAVARIKIGEGVAAAAADLALASWLAANRGENVGPLGLEPDDQDHRAELDRLADDPDPDRIPRYAKAAALAAAQTAFGKAMVRRGLSHWTRQPDAGACKVCTDLTGTVLPVSVPIWSHPGCGCTQKPVVTERN